MWKTSLVLPCSSSGAVDRSAERLADRLMSEADAEQGRVVLRRRVDERDARARAVGAAGAGADEHAVEGPALVTTGQQGIQVGQALVIVAPDHGLGPKLAEVLHQVEHEAVVVVDDQYTHASRVRGDPVGRRIHYLVG